MVEGGEYYLENSLIENIKARVVAQRWCRPPIRILMYNNFGPADVERTPSSALLFLFPEIDNRPEIVIKLNRDITALRLEYEALCTIEKFMKGLAPAPLFFESYGDWGILGMSSLYGKCLAAWDKRVKVLPIVVDRLLTCHLKLSGEIQRPYQFLSPQEVYAILKTVNGSPELLDQISDLWESVCIDLTKSALPCIAQHGDFCFPNILFYENNIFFLDWEDFGEITLPSYDVFCLLLNLYVPDGSHQGNMFFQDRVLLRHARQSVGRYFQGIGIPKELTRKLFEFTLIQQFLCSYRKKRSSTGLFVQRLVEYLKDPDRFLALLTDR